MAESSSFPCSAYEVVKCSNKRKFEEQEKPREDDLIYHGRHKPSVSRKRTRSEENLRDKLRPAKRRAESTTNRRHDAEGSRPDSACEGKDIATNIESEWSQSHSRGQEYGRPYHESIPDGLPLPEISVPRQPRLLRDLNHFPHDPDSGEILRCFDEVLAEEVFRYGSLMTRPSFPKKSRMFKNFDLYISDCPGTLDRFLRYFQPTIRPSIASVKQRSKNLAAAFFGIKVHGSLEQASDEWTSSPRSFAKQLKAHCSPLLAEAIRHQNRHLIRDGRSCLHFLPHEGCPGSVAEHGDHRSRGTKDPLAWDVQRIFVYSRAVELVKTHASWDEAYHRVAQFCNERGFKLTKVEGGSCDAFLDVISQLKEGTNPVDGNARLQRQLQPLVLRNVIEKLCSKTKAPQGRKSTTTAKWKQWVLNEVQELWELHKKQEQPEGHPFNELLQSDDIQTPEKLIELLAPLYSTLSEAIHKFFNLNINSVEDSLRAQVIRALTPESTKATGAFEYVDLEAEMARYLTAISGRRAATTEELVSSDQAESTIFRAKPQIGIWQSNNKHGTKSHGIERQPGQQKQKTRKKQKRKARNGFLCYECNQPGHLIHECPLRKKRHGQHKAVQRKASGKKRRGRKA